jgi:glutathione S-transferase
MHFVVVSRNLAPAAERQNRGARKAREVFESRLQLVTRQLAPSPYLAGETFTAADISVTYALEFAQRSGGVVLGEAERAYVARTSGREAYKRAMETCQATKAWAAAASSSAARPIESVSAEHHRRLKEVARGPGPFT